MTAEPRWTIGRLLQWTAQYLATKGADSPRLDAELLLAQVLGRPRIELYTSFDQEPDSQQRAQFRELVRRRAEGVPVAYLLGTKEFYSLTFRVTPAVLIPRPETEFVVVALLDAVRAWGDKPLDARGAVWEIADVGTGSGVLAICAARHIADCRVTALDCSSAALEVARLNATEHGVADRIEFVHSDLFAALPPEKRFHFVVSNPPYVASEEMASLPPEVRLHEPAVALEGGAAGTDVIQRLIVQAAQRLVPAGMLIFEISPMICDRVLALLDDAWNTPRVVKDLSGLARVVVVSRRSTAPCTT
jgi:release factor glutamine methyltransferase